MTPTDDAQAEAVTARNAEADPLRPDQKQQLHQVSQRMHWFGFLLIVFAAVSFAVTALPWLRMGTGGLAIGLLTWAGVVNAIFLAIAGYTLAAAKSLQQVSEKPHAGPRDLLEPLRSLKRLYGIQYWLIVILLVGLLLAVAGMLVWATSQ